MAVTSDLTDLRDRMGRLEEAMNGLTTAVTAQVAECRSCRPEVARHRLILDGRNGDPGLSTRVDRLEQSERLRDRALVTVKEAVVGVICAGAGALVTWALGLWG